ncbi:MAG TPA: helix-turn-helix domain-containing protein [Solirubrobacteraceae bacterium]|nr:helix-turn-helix domain-containing protein [Solirubrobacteraceae bacterium]
MLGGNGLKGSLEGERAGLSRRLRARRLEIEAAILAGDLAVFADSQADDAEYAAGRRAAVSGCLDYSLESIERGEDWLGPIPPAAAAQTRLAARAGVSLDTVMRCRAAGDRSLVELVMDEAVHCSGDVLRGALRVHGVHADRLMSLIADEYKNELDRIKRTPEQRRSELVRSLLANESTYQNGLGYELDDAWHVGIIATGAGAGAAIQSLLTAGIGRELLGVRCSEQDVWGWLGSSRLVTTAEVVRLTSTLLPDGVEFAIGEPAQGVDGWRLTHRQAQAARRVAIRRPQRITRYADVGPQAELLRDEAMSSSLVHIWLSPLDQAKDRGAALRKTLRAYLDAGCNAKTAAFELGVARHTVERHINEIEARLGRLPRTCVADLDIALRLEELGVGRRVPSSG